MPDATSVLAQPRTRDKLWRKPSLRQISSKGNAQPKLKDDGSSSAPKLVESRAIKERPIPRNHYDTRSPQETKPTAVLSNSSRVALEQPSRVQKNNTQIGSTVEKDLLTALEMPHVGDPEDFLPALNFDDLHSSLLRHDHIDHSSMYDDSTRQLESLEITNGGRGIQDANGVDGRRTTRISSNEGPYGQSGNAFGAKPIPELQAAVSRRLTQLPSNKTGNFSSTIRKSVGPGTFARDSYEQQDKTTLSLQNRSSIYQSPRSIPMTGAQDSVSSRRSGLTANKRAVRSQSLYPSGEQVHIPSAQLLSESMRIPATSPGKAARRDIATLGNTAKRHSVAPSHLSGLGARTISPTDTRRLHRLSTMPEPATPQELVPLRLADSSPAWPMNRSQNLPSFSDSPGPSTRNDQPLFTVDRSSLQGLDPAHEANDSIQAPSPSQHPRIYSSQKSFSTSPREESTNPFRNGHVPPVPAIPKTYESPKSELEEHSLVQGASSFMADSASTHSSKADYISASTSPSGDYNSSSTGESHTNVRAKANEAAHFSRSDGILLPQHSLRLPPLNLMPLSGATTERIAAIHDRRQRAGHTPPPIRNPRKTPTTPMTASKASFFSRSHGSIHRHLSHSRSTYFDPTIDFGIQSAQGGTTISDEDRGIFNSAVSMKPNSPYLSTSLPRESYEKAGPSTASDSTCTSSAFNSQKAKPAGPRTMAVADQPDPSKLPRYSVPDPDVTDRNYELAPQSRSELGQEDGPNLMDKQTKGPTWARSEQSTQEISSLSIADPASLTHLSTENHRRTTQADISLGRIRARRSVQSLAARNEPDLEGRQNKITGRESVSVRQSLSNGRPALDNALDAHDLNAEEEMRRLALARRNTESAARELDALRRRARPSRSLTVSQALRTEKLNIFEKGEIVDFHNIYFCGTPACQKHEGDAESRLANFGYDDERGDYHIVFGDHIGYRYEIVDLLGKGSFGQVVRCIDHKTGKLVAIKIIRNKKRFHQQALVEVDILQKIREWDPDSHHSMVNFTQSFYFRGHLCISTELLDMNLYEFIKIHDFKGFSLKLIRRFTKQLLNSLVLLKKHNIIHCDLKPENILLVHPVHSEIKVIDFGSSCHENERVYTYIQSRFYRSPEVILGMTYGLGIDMWSLGCILAELFTGYPIFPGENEQEQLACIMEVFGPPDKHLIEKSSRKKLFFDSLGKPRLTISSKGRRRRPSSKTLQQVLRCDDEAFLDFLTRCLRWDPEKRLKPEDAASHEFITGAKVLQHSKNLRSPSSALSISGVSTSPIKRYNSLHISAKTSSESKDQTKAKYSTGTAHRIREPNGGSLRNPSPEKVSFKRPGLPASSVNAANGGRRFTTMPSSVSNTSIKIPPSRTTSGKPDLAAKAAAAAAAATKQR